MKPEPNEDRAIYFLAFGPLIGTVLGLLLNLVFRNVPLIFFLGIGPAIGLLGGSVLYAFFNNKDQP
ncbi:hypothetical protein [Marinilactibacillus sp. Marseille-P9653]|uniref:hypothetical protein n=1 Tax=Marinilactibacillus sp. Marseille-P9653 TaxID=2866583 RepID=UPI001CE3FDF2|nr:hypothetical protein [Marinilactibacillus sp. Marseille-P9653]